MAVAFVQKSIATANGTTINAAINGVAAGSLLLVGLVADQTPQTLLSIGDGGVNNYLRTPRSPSFGNNGISYIYYVINAVGGNLTVATSWSTNSVHSIWVREFSGFGVGSFHSDASGSGNGAAINSPSILTSAGDLLYGVAYTAGAITATGAPWAAADTNIQNGEADEYQLSGAGGSVAVNWASSSANWSSMAACFTPGAAPATGRIQREGGTGNVALETAPGGIKLEY